MFRDYEENCFSWKGSNLNFAQVSGMRFKDKYLLDEVKENAMHAFKII